MTVLVLTILLATAAQLATLSATRGLIASRRANSLQHELAVQSAMHVLAQALSKDPAYHRCLARDRRVFVDLTVGACIVRVLIQDDGAKFNVLPWAEERSLTLLRRKLETLGRDLGLPALTIEPRLVRFDGQEASSKPSPVRPARGSEALVTFDQLFREAPAPAVFHWHLEADALEPVWSDYVSLFGDGRMDLKNADRKLVELALGDIRAGLKPSPRGAGAADDAWAGLGPGTRSRVAARTGYGLDRYALTLQTAIGSDVRRWYVVATLKNGAMTLHHRRQITW